MYRSDNVPSSQADEVLQYNIFTLIFSWFALANMWLTFSIIIDLLPSQDVNIFGTNTIVGITTS